MRYAIFSDIHSNLESLEEVLRAYGKENIDKYLCIGDIVGYAANPKECIKIVQDRMIKTVAGNHDWAVTGKFNLSYFNKYAKEAIIWTARQLDSQEKMYLSGLDLVYQEENFCLVHGTLPNAGDFDYMMGVEDARQTFEVMKIAICFVGHTHVPAIFIKERDSVGYVQDNLIEIEPEKQYVVNVGSVGQPRDHDSRACYCIYDSKEKTVEIKRIEYNIKETQEKILKVGLPSFLAKRLSQGD